jgi:hypothetical protein
MLNLWKIQKDFRVYLRSCIFHDKRVLRCQTGCEVENTLWGTKKRKEKRPLERREASKKTG